MEQRSLFVALILSCSFISACVKEITLPKAQQEKSSLSQTSSSKNSILGGRIPADDEDIRLSTVGLYDVESKALCTGTIIGKRLVLTAAHCVGEDSKIVVFFAPTMDELEPATIAVAVTINAAYGTTESEIVDTSDVALLLLKHEIPDTHKIAPVVPEGYTPSEGDEMIIAGFGVTNGLRKKHSGTMRTTSVQVVQGQLGESEFVTDQTDGSGACFGDSGGPAYVYSQGRYYLMGVASRVFNPDGDPCKGIGIYSNAGYYRPFIRDSIKSFSSIE